jgi:hypothetical protein
LETVRRSLQMKKRTAYVLEVIFARLWPDTIVQSAEQMLLKFDMEDFQ